MTSFKVRTFKSGNFQAIRLPREIAYGDEIELLAFRSGDVLTLYPASLSVAEMVKRLAALPAPPSIEEREEFEFSERGGL